MRPIPILIAVLLAAVRVSAQPTLTYLNSLNQSPNNDGDGGKVIAGPWLDAAGTKMVFIQGDGPYFTAKSASGAWKKPTSFQQPILFVRIAGFDGSRIFFDDLESLSYIDLVGNGFWTTPTAAFNFRKGLCEVAGTLESRHERLAISADRQLVVFSKFDAAKKEAPTRLYFALKDKLKNDWSYENCRPVNTPADARTNVAEIRPTLLPDGKTLLYILRTTQWESATSTTIVDRQYVTQLLDDGTWALPRPTGGDKYFYTWANANMDTAYFRTTSGRIGYAVDPAGVILPRSSLIVKPEHAQERAVSKTESIAAKKPTPIVGRYYALLIGVSDYDNDKLDLAMPVRDVASIKEVLSSSYTFDESDITVLDNPTRQQIFKELSRLRNTITERDNLLIFFAGHGSWDKNINQGYWWPSNAMPDDPSNWLSNSDLREQIRGIHSAHTLLISDACFSGGIFRTRNAEDIKKAPLEVAALYKIKSRRAITSGALSSVPDNSVFTKYLLTRLNENPDDYLPSQSLFYSMRLAVIHNSLAVPQDGVIGDAGDEGGDFIFIRRQ